MCIRDRYCSVLLMLLCPAMYCTCRILFVFNQFMITLVLICLLSMMSGFSFFAWLTNLHIMSLCFLVGNRNGFGLNYWWGNNIAYNRNSWSFFNVDKPDFVIDMGIPNVGSLAKNDCYPTTFSEIEAKKGGSRSYQDFAKNANYSEGKGLIINRSDYRNLMNTTFGTVDILDGNAANQVFDPSFMRKMCIRDRSISKASQSAADHRE